MGHIVYSHIIFVSSKLPTASSSLSHHCRSRIARATWDTYDVPLADRASPLACSLRRNQHKQSSSLSHHCRSRIARATWDIYDVPLADRASPLACSLRRNQHKQSSSLSLHCCSRITRATALYDTALANRSALCFCSWAPLA